VKADEAGTAGNENMHQSPPNRSLV
jgi:hypothetical protein